MMMLSFAVLEAEVVAVTDVERKVEGTASKTVAAEEVQGEADLVPVNGE